MKTKILLTVWLLLIATCFSCEKTDNDSDGSNNKDVNSWILKNMKGYYYWDKSIPTNTDLALNPALYFKSILNKNEDRFSWIQDNADELKNMLNGVGKSFGYEQKLYPKSKGSNKLVGQIIYVEPASPASEAGLVRGDLFTTVNGVELTTENYANLIFSNSETISLGLVTPQGNSLVQTGTKTITARVLQENPIAMEKILQVNGKTIGYFLYKQFVVDPGDKSGKYDKEMEAVFGRFKSAGVNELILDLRMNTGGAISSSIKLASLIVKNLNTNNVFIKSEYNEGLQAYIVSQEGENSLVSKFVAEPNNIGNTINRLVVITSGHTASASELIINGLRPYMDVILVGETTYGKNVGSTTIWDKTKKISWAMQPIILKLFNSLNESNYTKGFTPNIAVTDNDLLLKPFGDENEKLLNAAISALTGRATGARVKAYAPAFESQAIDNSLAHKAGAFNMYVNK